jgi:hypothetical protein
VFPADNKKEKVEGGKSVEGDRENHVRNFLDCMRSRKLPVSDVAIAHDVTTTGHLGNIAFRTQRTIHWDAANERILGDPAASRLLTKPYRAPWKLPT